MKTLGATLLCLLLVLAAQAQDQDLPGWEAPTETLEYLSLIIPMDRVYQGRTSSGLANTYVANGQGSQGSFNMRAYGLVNKLLWSDVPVKWIIKNNKSYDDYDFCARTWERFPTDERVQAIPAQTRCFRAGPFAVPSTYTTIAETVMQKYTTDPAYAYTITYTTVNGAKVITITQGSALSSTDKLVRVYRIAETAGVQVNVRYSIYARPYPACLDSSKYFTIEADNLMAAGFIPGIHFTVMTKDEAYQFNTETCVTFATEPHFLANAEGNDGELNPNATNVRGFVSAVRKFVQSGGNFVSQCGGSSTYEQCDNVLPNGYNGRSCPPSPNNITNCPDGFFVTTKGLFFAKDLEHGISNGKCPTTPNGVEVTPWLHGDKNWADGAPVKIAHPDLPVNQFDGSWKWTGGELEWFTLWKTGYNGTAYGGIDSDWHPTNKGHPLVESVDENYYTGCYNNTGTAPTCSELHNYCTECRARGCRYCRSYGGNNYRCRSGSSCGDGYYTYTSTCPSQTAWKATCNPNVPGVFFAAHSKLATSHGKNGGNVFYLAGHRYGNDNGRRLFLNAVMHPSERSRNCTVMVPQCDANGQNCEEVPKDFYVDPCAYVTPDWLKANLTNTSISVQTLSTVVSLLKSNTFDNPSPLLTDTSIVTTCPTRICVTWLGGTTRHDSIGYFTWDDVNNQVLTQSVLFPDTAINSSCIVPGATYCIPQTFPAGTTVGWYVAVGGIYSANPRILYSLNPVGQATGNYIRFGLNNTNFVAFSSTSDLTDNYDELLWSYSLTSPTCEPPPPTYDNSTCYDFDPNDYASAWYKSTCIDFVPLNVGEQQCGTPVAIPDGWILAPVDADFNNVISTYSNNWPQGCYQGTSDTSSTGYASYQNCTPTKVTYVTFVNAAGDVCIRADCSDHLLLQSQTVDTRCHPDNYDQYCTFADPSSIVDNNTVLPSAIFVNLIGNKSVTYNLNAGPPPNTIEIMFLIDVNNLASVRVAKTYFRDYILTALNSLPSTLNVGFGYAWSDGTLRGGQGIFYDKTLIDLWPDPSCNVPGGVCTSKNILDVLRQLASSAAVGWQPDTNIPHHRVIVVLSDTVYNASHLNANLMTALRDNDITPLFVTSTSRYSLYSAINNTVDWSVITSGPLTTLSDVTPPLSTANTPAWVPAFYQDIATIRNAFTGFVVNDPWAVISPRSSKSNAFIFQDRTATASPTTSSYPLTAPGTNYYNHKINLCSYPSFPANTSETLRYIDYWGASGFVAYADSSVLGTCDCAEQPAGAIQTVANLKTRPVSIMNLPTDHSGPVIRVFGRVSRQTYVTVARDPSYANPEIYLTVAENTPSSVLLYANPSSLLGENEQKVYVSVQSVDNPTGFSSLTMYDGSNPDQYSPVRYQSGPYDVCGQSSSKGFNFTGAPKYCKLGDGSVPRGKPSTWGESTIFYRFCDGCNCASGPVARRGGAFVKVTFTCGNSNLPPVGTDLTFTVLPSSTNTITLSGNISDPDDVTADLFIRFSQLQPTPGSVRSNVDNSLLDNSAILQSSQVFRFVQGPTSTSSSFKYTVLDPYGGISPSYTITINVYKPPVWTVDKQALTVVPGDSGTFTFTITDEDSDFLIYDIAAAQRQQIPTPSVMTFAYANGTTVDVLTAGSSIAVIPNPNKNTPITVTLTWAADEALPNATTGTFINSLVDSEGLTAPNISLKLTVFTVIPPNSPPFGTQPDDTIETEEDTSVNITIVASDPETDQQQELSLTLTTLPTNGKLLFASTGVEVTPNDLNTVIQYSGPVEAGTATVFTYVPNPNYAGPDSFVFVATDPPGLTSEPFLVEISVTAVDDPPVSHDVTLVVLENTCLLDTCAVVSSTFNTTEITGSDPEGTAVTLTILTVPDPENGVLLYWWGEGWSEVTESETLEGTDWTFSFQPVMYAHGTADVPFETFTYRVTSNALDSETNYTGLIYVLPVNQAPTCEDIDVITDMNTNITINLPYADIDNEEEELRLAVVDVVFGSLGSFFFGDSAVGAAGGDVETDFTPLFQPQADQYSNPSTVPLGSMTFRVVDENGSGLSSPICTARVFVNFVPLNITYSNNTVITLAEDTSVSFFVDRYGIDWFGGNVGFQSVTVSIDKMVGNGTLLVCQTGTSVCEVIDAEPFNIPPGSTLRFVPSPNESGNNYYNFTLNFTVPTGAPPLLVDFVVNVIPINDPPTITPHYSTTKDVLNVCDEDTYFVVSFEANDIDSPVGSLRAHFVTYLDQNVKNTIYLCDGDVNTAPVIYDGHCAPGTIVTKNMFWANASNGKKRQSDEAAVFSMLFVPDPNVNGVTRFIVAVVDDYGASSPASVVEITVLPINDPPSFAVLEGELVYNSQTNSSDFLISGKVADIDFKFGKRMELTIVADNSTGNGTWAPITAQNSPCNVSEDGLTLFCADIINKLNSWFTVGFTFLPASDQQSVNFTLTIDDLGNIDKDLNPNSTTTWIVLAANGTLTDLIATVPASDNGLIIGASIGGLLAGIGLVALVVLLRGKKAAAKVDSYFERMAIDMEGNSNTSPLYSGAAKGGESVLYTGKDK